MVGKSVNDPNASIAGSIAIAMHVRCVAKYYGIPVVLHSDHCSKKLLPWFEGMLKADEDFFKLYGEPLFSSHMLDLSKEKDDENIAICTEYFKRMVKMNIWLEIEIGITGGEQGGINLENVVSEKLYTTPQQVYNVYKSLSKIGSMFSIAAAFGNACGVYKPGNVKLSPERLLTHQKYVKKMTDSPLEKPIFFVMHGGSGSTDNEISTAVRSGVVKMNIDTDTQWAYWDGFRMFEKKTHDYLQAQIGNPSGPDKPNKSYYDPRVWLRKAEESMSNRVGVSMQKLGSVGRYHASKKPGSTQLGKPRKSPDRIILFSTAILIGSICTFAIKLFTK